jgi:hypothetical protein
VGEIALACSFFFHFYGKLSRSIEKVSFLLLPESDEGREEVRRKSDGQRQKSLPVTGFRAVNIFN